MPQENQSAKVVQTNAQAIRTRKGAGGSAKPSQRDHSRYCDPRPASMGYILAIDPGTTHSAYVVVDESYTPIQFAKIDNNELLSLIPALIDKYSIAESAIEMIASYGARVGREVFETCVWIGRYHEAVARCGASVEHVYRKDVKMNLCGTNKAKDKDVRAALVKRFARHDFKNGKGTKDNRDTFYGVSADVWSAMGVAVYYLDKGCEED
jgi:hypothetical protein